MQSIISGFYFSSDEPTALVQAEGGPCAVIAPVQAFILQQLLTEADVSTWRNISLDKSYELLVQAYIKILKQTKGNTVPQFSVVYMDYKPSDKESDKNKWSKKVSQIQSEGQEETSEELMEGIDENCTNINIDTFHTQLR